MASVSKMYADMPSGCNAFFTFKRFSNASASALNYTKVVNPSPLTGTGVTTISPGNRRNDVSPNSGLTMTYGSMTTSTPTGTSTIMSPVYATSDKEITTLDMLAPGTSLGYTISGLTGAFTGAVTVGITYAGYCEPVN